MPGVFWNPKEASMSEAEHMPGRGGEGRSERKQGQILRAGVLALGQVRDEGVRTRMTGNVEGSFQLLLIF